DDVIGRDAEVGRPFLDHLQHRVQHAGHGAERRIFILVEAAEAIKMPEELVGAVEKMNDHAAAQVQTSEPRSAMPLPQNPLGAVARDYGPGSLCATRTPGRRESTRVDCPPSYNSRCLGEISCRFSGF